MPKNSFVLAEFPPKEAYDKLLEGSIFKDKNFWIGHPLVPVSGGGMTMNDLSPQMLAGQRLRKLIAENFPSQEEFAFQYGADVRTINRYINNGINKLDIIQELADWFGVDFMDFLQERNDA